MSANKWDGFVKYLTYDIFIAEDQRLRDQAIDLSRRSVVLDQTNPSDKQRLNITYLKFSLHPDLETEVSGHLQDLHNIVFEKDRVKQMLTQILKDCISHQDVIDVLPKSTHETLRSIDDKFTLLSPAREDGWTVKENPRLYRQYLKIRDKIDYYYIARVLY